MKQNIIFLATMALIVCVMTVGVFAFSRPEFSEDENRMLNPPPHASFENVASGKYFSRLSAFYSDAVPFRRSMIRLGTVCELGLGKKQNNGVIFEKERLIDRLEYESCDRLISNIKKTAEGFEGRQGCVCAVVPRSADIYLEGESVDSVYAAVSESLGAWELCDRLKQGMLDGGQIYYKTDHHLSGDGAYILYSYVMHSLGFEPYSQADFDREIFADDFLGSIYSKSGILPIAYDEVELWRYEGDTELEVHCEDAGCALSSLYCFEAADIKDKYRVFTDGNHGMIHVRLPSGERRQTLLIYKDSFANAVLPLLARHFDLVVCDPRYTSAQSCPCDYTAVIMGVDTLNTIG